MKLTESYLKKIIKEETVNEPSFMDKLKARIAPLSQTSIAGSPAGQEYMSGEIKTANRKRARALEKLSEVRAKIIEMQYNARFPEYYHIFDVPEARKAALDTQRNNIVVYGKSGRTRQKFYGPDLFEALKKPYSEVQFDDQVLDELIQKLDNLLNNNDIVKAVKTNIYDPNRTKNQTEKDIGYWQAQARQAAALAQHRQEAGLAVPKEEPEQVMNVYGVGGRNAAYTIPKPVKENKNKKGVNNTMQLTTERLKQIIKEELEEIVKEMGEETEEVSEVNAEIASLEQQLAEAKKKAAKMQGAKGKATKKPLGAAAHGDHKMMPAKRHDKKKGGY